MMFSSSIARICRKVAASNFAVAKHTCASFSTFKYTATHEYIKVSLSNLFIHPGLIFGWLLTEIASKQNPEHNDFIVLLQLERLTVISALLAFLSMPLMH